MRRRSMLTLWQRSVCFLIVVAPPVVLLVQMAGGLLNRLDDIVVFESLSTEELTSIVDIQLGLLGKRLAARRLALEVSDGAREWLAMNGFDPLYGARPLRRLVQSAIGDQLARALLAGEITDGDTVRVDLNGSMLGSAGPTAGLTVGKGVRTTG